MLGKWYRQVLKVLWEEKQGSSCAERLGEVLAGAKSGT